MAKQIEVFTAGCALCGPILALVDEMACPSCEVTVYDLRESGSDQAARYGLRTVPAVVIDGNLVSCCATPGPTREALAQAGIGQRL